MHHGRKRAASRHPAAGLEFVRGTLFDGDKGDAAGALALKADMVQVGIAEASAAEVAHVFLRGAEGEVAKHDGVAAGRVRLQQNTKRIE